jgi:uncharacterized pyridoxamine 5'-phosphate oxidase family protein
MVKNQIKLEEKIKKIEKVLKKKGEIALATSNKKGNIHVCMMNYVKPQRSTLLMSCDPASTKVKNIQKNPQVGMVKFEVKEKPSLLLYGKAQILNKKDSPSAYRTILNIAPEYKAFTNLKRAFIRVDIERVVYEWYFTHDGKTIYFELGKFK